MTLKNRIRLAFAILGVFLGISGVVAIIGNKNTFKVASSLAYTDLPSIAENSKMYGIAKDMRSLIFRLNLKNVDESIVGKIESRFNELYDEYQAAKREYLAIPFPDEKEKNHFIKVEANFETWIKISRDMIGLKKKDFNSTDFDSKLNSDYREAANSYLSSMTEFLDEASANSKRKINVLEETNKRNEALLIFSLVFGVSVAIAGNIFIAKSTGGRLEDLYSTFKLKYKDLHDNCSLGDEISQSNLLRVDTQGSSIELTSAAAEETSKSIEAVASQAKKLKSQTEYNKEILNDSGKSLNQLDASIQKVNEINDKLSLRLEKNNDDLRQIIEIFKDIESRMSLAA